MKAWIPAGALVALSLGGFAALYPEDLSYKRVIETVRKPPPPPRVDILFGGDMMFDRHIREAMERNGDNIVFSCIGETLLDPELELVVANLEGPITDNPSMSQTAEFMTPEHFTFTFATTTAELLSRFNIKLVNLGNNHMLNFSRGGLLQTKQWLDAAGVAYFGDPDFPEAERVERMDINSIPFSFVNWSDWTSDKTDHTVQQVRKEKQSGRIVVVYTHWGEEYVEPPPRVKQLAHSFVDAGADIVIGSHPHIIQEHELYNGKFIYYSLGNMVFDQYWNEEVRTGLLLKITFDSKGVTNIEEIRTELQRDGRTCLIE